MCTSVWGDQISANITLEESVGEGENEKHPTMNKKPEGKEEYWK